MGMNKTYAVFGMGRYGSAVAKELVRNGAEVLAVDSNESIVNSLIGEIPYCKCADVTDAEVIKQLGIANMDVVIVAMASSLESSVMTVMLCKEAGVPKVIVKCASETHRKIFEKIGADKVVLPEVESGARMAKNLLTDGFIDAVELSGEISLLEFDVKKEWIGKSLAELNLRKKYMLNVVAIRKDGGLEVSIDPTMVLQEGMELIVIMHTSQIGKLKK